MAQGQIVHKQGVESHIRTSPVKPQGAVGLALLAALNGKEK